MREPTPYTPTEAELQALGARLFGLEEHRPVAFERANESVMTSDKTRKETDDEYPKIQ